MIVVGDACVDAEPLRPFGAKRSERASERLFTGVRRLSEALAQSPDPPAIAACVLGEVAASVRPTWAALALSVPVPALYTAGSPPSDLSAEALIERAEDASARARSPEAPVRLHADGLVLGALTCGPPAGIDTHGPTERALLQAIGSLASMALKNALLVRYLEMQRAALRERERSIAALTTRLTEAQEEERHRLALDLHDDSLQRAILLSRELSDAAVSEVPRAATWRASAEGIVGSLRATCHDLRPSVLEELGLVAGLAWLADECERRGGLATSFVVEAPEPPGIDDLPADLALALYRVAQEALNNCQKHAQASRVTIFLQRFGDVVRLNVMDDGRGARREDGAEEDGAEDDAEIAQHVGLQGMRERLRPWGGEIAVEASPGGGTMLVATSRTERV